MNADLGDRRVAEVEPREALSIAAARWNAPLRRWKSVSKGVFSIFDQAIVSGTSFLTAAIIGRVSAPDQLGLYYLVLSIVLIASGMMDQLIASPYVVYSKRCRGRGLVEYSGSIWVHHFVLTFLLTGSLLLGISICWIAGATESLPVLWALLSGGPLILLREGIRRFAFANLRVKSVIVFDASVSSVQLGGLAALAYAGRLTLINIYAVMGAACALAAVLWYVLDPPRVRFVFERLIPDWRNNWAFGKWALRSFLVGSTTPQVMLWIVSVAVGAAATGVLGACTTLVGVTNVLLLGVSNVLTPQAAHAYATGGAAELRRVLCVAAAVLFGPLCAFCVLILLTGDWLTVFVFGPSYAGTGQTLFILALSMLMVSMGTVAGNGLWAIDQPRLNFVADVCCMVVTLGTAALLVSRLGVRGAALATLAGAFSASIVRAMTLLRCLEAESRGTRSEATSALSL
jgi:O-antigen/teichoic acid export membrane protein